MHSAKKFSREKIGIWIAWSVLSTLLLYALLHSPAGLILVIIVGLSGQGFAILTAIAVGGGIVGRLVCGHHGGFVRGVAFSLTPFVILSLVLSATKALEPESHGSRERRKAISRCKLELPSIAKEYFVESLLVESGEIEDEMLEKLLGKRGLQFVELQTKRLPAYADLPEEWGVVSAIGRRYVTPRESQFVKISLAQKGDPKCVEHLFDSDRRKLGVPFSPKACFRVEAVQESSSSHAIRSIPASDHSGYIRWSLIDLRTGKTLAALTSNDLADRPSSSHSTNVSEMKSVFHGTVDCGAPHHSIMATLRARPRAEFPRLTLSTRLVETEGIGISTQRRTATVHVEEKSIGDWKELRHGEHGIERISGEENGWTEAFLRAEKEGWAALDGYLLDYNSGELISIDMAGNITASKSGFVYKTSYSTTGSRPWDTMLISYSVTGKVLQRVLLKTERNRAESELGYCDAGLNWTNNEVLSYDTKCEPGKDEIWVRKIPVEKLNLAPAE